MVGLFLFKKSFNVKSSGVIIAIELAFNNKKRL